jgi:hypothetical protein
MLLVKALEIFSTLMPLNYKDSTTMIFILCIISNGFSHIINLGFLLYRTSLSIDGVIFTNSLNP